MNPADHNSNSESSEAMRRPIDACKVSMRETEKAIADMFERMSRQQLKMDLVSAKWDLWQNGDVW